MHPHINICFPPVFSLSGTAALEEDAQILKVIEAYCTSAKTRQTLNSSKITQKSYLYCTCACTKEERFTLELSVFVTAIPVFCYSMLFFNTGVLN